MADKKISQLTGASTPLAGTEVLPIVQSGSTVKVSAADVTAGRAVSALTYTSTATTGTAPFTVSSTTQVANLNAATAGTANNLKSNATTGVIQVVGPAAASTRVMTTPDANFTAARTDASQTFTGAQTFTNGVVLNADSTMNLPSIGGNISINVPVPSASTAKSQLIFTGTSDYRATFKVKLNKDQADNAPVDVMQWGPGVDVTLSAGNLVVGTAAKGIDFSANTHAAGMTSELLNWYEEGTWTPTIVAGALTINATACYYTRIGNQVTLFFDVTYPAQTNANDADLFDLPFTIKSNGGSAGAIATDRSSTDPTYAFGFNGQTRLRFSDGALSVLTLTGMSGKRVKGSFTYQV